MENSLENQSFDLEEYDRFKMNLEDVDIIDYNELDYIISQYGEKKLFDYLELLMIESNQIIMDKFTPNLKEYIIDQLKLNKESKSSLFLYYKQIKNTYCEEELNESFKIINNYKDVVKKRNITLKKLQNSIKSVILSANISEEQMAEYKKIIELINANNFLLNSSNIKACNKFLNSLILNNLYNKDLIILLNEINIYEKYLLAYEKIILSNLKLVIFVARKICSKDMELDDLIQEGNIALYNAIEKFNYEQGIAFSTYAYYCIKSAMIRYYLNNYSSIRIPLNFNETLNSYLKNYQDCLNENGFKPSYEELAKRMKLKYSTENQINNSNRNLDLCKVYSSGIETLNINLDEDIIRDNYVFPTMDEIEINNFIKKDLDKKIKKYLSKKDIKISEYEIRKFIITFLHFGLNINDYFDKKYIDKFILEIESNYIKNVNNSETKNVYMVFINEYQKSILNNNYELRDYSMRELSELIGISNQRIRNIIFDTINKIKLLYYKNNEGDCSKIKKKTW